MNFKGLSGSHLQWCVRLNLTSNQLTCQASHRVLQVMSEPPPKHFRIHPLVPIPTHSAFVQAAIVPHLPGDGRIQGKERLGSQVTIEVQNQE